MVKVLESIKFISILVALALVLALGIVAAPLAGVVEAQLPCSCGDICVNTTGWWPNGGTFTASATPIQDAVNNASSGDIICVQDGTYIENVNVNTAHLTIQSQSGTTNCIVNASNPADYVFDVTADWVNITGLTIQKGNMTNRAGIRLDSADYCNISGNNITNNYRGIILNYSDNNTLTNNNVSNNFDTGVHLEDSNYNNLTNNDVWNNDNDSIYLWSSDNNTFTDNDAWDNTDGIYLRSSNNNNLTKTSPTTTPGTTATAST